MVGPLTATDAMSGASSLVAVAASEAPQVVEAFAFAAGAAVTTGGGLCRPRGAPAPVSQQRWGVSDPASASHLRPRARPAGSLTPHTSVSMMCRGARLMFGEIVRARCCRQRSGNEPELCPASVELVDTIPHRLAVAPVLDFPGALGRVKASFADAHRGAALTRPARSRSPAITGATE